MKCCRIFSARAVTDEAIEAGIAGLRGEISQRPSSVSAVKIGGKRAYQLVREGRGRPARRAQCPHRPLRGAGDSPPRSSNRGRRLRRRRRRGGLLVGNLHPRLARDLGETLAVGGHLTALRRTRVGGFGLEHARTLEQLEEHPRLSYDLDAACPSAFARRDISAAEAQDAAHGRPLAATGAEGVYAAIDPDGRVIALLEDRGERTKSVVVIRPATLE